MTSPLPRVGGFRAISAHDCSRCGQIVRVMFAAIPGEAPDREGKHTESLFKEFRTPDGAFAELVSSSHFELDQAYYYADWRAKPCGYVVPKPAQDKPESFIQQIYGRFFSYPTKPLERIVRFNVEALLASPLVITANAREIGDIELRKPLLLIANKTMLRHIMATGSVPPPSTNLTTIAIDTAMAAKAGQDFLNLIEAETMRIQL